MATLNQRAPQHLRPHQPQRPRQILNKLWTPTNKPRNHQAGYNNKAQAFLSRGAQAIVRMRGLPFTCSAQQVVEFFSEQGPREQRCQVLGAQEGVLFVKNQDEKPTGDAFVLFDSDQAAQCALAKHRQNIGARYVELFRSSISEVQQVLSMNSAGPQPGQPQQELGARRKQSPSAPAPKQPAPKAKEATYAQVATSYLHTPAKSTDDKSASSSRSSSSGAFDATSLNSLAAPELKPGALASTSSSTLADASKLLSSADSSSQSPISSPGSTSYKSSSSLSSAGSRCQQPAESGPLASSHAGHYHDHYQQSGLAMGEPGGLQHAHLYHQQHLAAGVNYPSALVAPGEPAAGAHLLAGQAPPQAYLAASRHSAFAQHQGQLAYAAGASPYAAAQLAYSFQFYPAASQQHAAYPAPAQGQHSLVHGATNRRDCIRLRGLPFEAQIEDVLYFLADQSKNIAYQGVHMVYSAQGQPTGEAIIQMNSCAAAQQTAQEFHKKVMSVGKKQRYIEVIPSSIEDMNLMLGGQLRSVPAHQHHAYYAPVLGPAAPGDLHAPGADDKQPSAAKTDQAGDAHATKAGQANLMPAYYPVLYYYPQQVLAAPSYH